MKTWEYPPGAIVTRCPTCHRPVPPRPLQAIDLVKRLCRCGQPWTRRAEKRIRNWVCVRKVPYTQEQANERAGIIRAEQHRRSAPYPCPFGNHYHIGNPLQE